MPTYALTNPDTTDPLNTPSHATLHTQTNAAIADLGSRVTTIEGALTNTADDIEQARRVANTWTIPGDLAGKASSAVLILPVLWNLTGRAVKFEAAAATVLTAPGGGGITVDIVVGADPSTTPTDSILLTPLVIPSGAYTAPFVNDTGFDTPVMNPGQFVGVVLKIVGTSPAGANLTVQLNRLL